MKFGLRNVRTLLADAGHPERAFPSLHVAGTNGKGSTSAFLASIFREAGCKTGLYTSPHLIRFNERITVNGAEIADERLAWYVAVLRPSIERTRATFFEATTCVAFLYFADEGVDIAVIEAGLGGRLDATNVVRPLVSVVTNVSFDHMDLLGNTLRKIAREKAGIIKKGVPVVTGSEDPAVLDVVRRTARARNTRLYRTKGFRMPSVSLGLRGSYQTKNAHLAVAAAQIVRRTWARAFPGLTGGAIRRGLARVKGNTGLRGRFHLLNAGGERYLIDVAHNREGMKTLLGELRRLKHPPRAVVFGVMKDKEFGAMLDELSLVAGTLVAVTPFLQRALPVGVIVREGRRRGMRVIAGGSVKSGLRLARRITGKGPLLVTGSHYVAGEALRALCGEDA
jgi:dihydrofolate synthase/folylpolyglutamate synthase